MLFIMEVRASVPGTLHERVARVARVAFRYRRAAPARDMLSKKFTHCGYTSYT